jgi:rubredoxin
VDNSVLKDKVAMPGVEPAKQIPDSTDCPECGTPGRLILTTSFQS